MKPPRVPEELPPVLREDHIERRSLRRVIRDQIPRGRRDAALIRVFIDTGARLSEVTNLRWNPDDDTQNDIDLERGVLSGDW